MALSYAEIDSQRVELLPPRTVMSLFTMQGTGTGTTIDISNNRVCGIGIGQVGVGVGVIGIGLGNFSPGYACTG